MFEYAPLVQGFTLLLRCQYRLTSRSATRRVLRYPIGTAQQARHLAVSRSLNAEHSLPNYDATMGEGLVTPTTRFISAAVSYLEETQTKATVLGGKWKRLERGSKDSLGLHALGEPAKVLLLRDGEHSKEKDSDTLEIRSEGPDKNPAFEAMSSSDMLKKINGERGQVDMEQACQSIENIKTAWMARVRSRSNPVSIAEYKDLSSQLRNGFSLRQLAAYRETADAKLPKGPLDLRNDFASHLYTRSRWVPVTFPQPPKPPRFVDHVKDKNLEADFVHERRDKNLTYKPNLVERILRQCWDLKVENDDVLEGELQIRLRSTHLSLITNYKRGTLKQLSESYGANIEALENGQMLRIISDYDTCLDILKVIVFTLGNIRTSEIALPSRLEGHLKSSSFIEPEASILRQVENLTNTVIKSRSSSSWLRELHVYYMGPDNIDFQDARRLINQIIRPKPADKGFLVMCGALSPLQVLPAPVDVGNGLHLMSKSQQWSRWCNPGIKENGLRNRKPTSVAALNTSASLFNCDRAAAKSLTKFFAPPGKEREAEGTSNPYWESTTLYLDSAVLGQVLFPTNAAEQKAASIQAKSTETKDVKIEDELGHWRGEFVTQVPRMLQTFEALGAVASKPELGSVESLHIRLSPSFKNASLSIPIELLPDLEIRVYLDNKSRTATVEYARLVHSKKLNLLLPENIVDIRFTRQTCVYWRCGSLDPKIQRFLQDSNLDIWGSERLKTPTELELEIPSYAMRPHTFPVVERAATTRAEYTFTSLEHYSELGIPFQEHDPRTNLTYTSIEGGKTGGRRDELALRHCGDDIRKTIHLNEEGVEENAAQSAVFDKANSASLIRKANALINAIEGQANNSHTDYASTAFTSGVKKEERTSGKSKRRELGRTRKREREPLPRRTTADKE